MRKLEAEALLPRLRYKPRRGLELLYDCALLGSFLFGFHCVLTASKTLYMLLGTVLLIVVNIHAILLFHDCMHQSAFGNRRLETWVARLIGAYYGCPFHFLRAEHLQHHRRSGLVEDDPEALHLSFEDAGLRPTGRLLARIANSPGDAFLYTWILQLGQFGRWVRNQCLSNAKSTANTGSASNVGNSDRALLQNTLIDVALMLVVWGPLTFYLVQRGAYLRVLLCAFVLPAIAGLAIVYKSAKPLHTLMIPFRLSDLPYLQRQICVTRTFQTNRLLAFLICNLNYHIEHHLYPQVSRWDLPALSQMLRPALLAYAQQNDLPLAVHKGYASWVQRYKQVASTYNSIERWQDWYTKNEGFAYASFHAPGPAKKECP